MNLRSACTGTARIPILFVSRTLESVAMAISTLIDDRSSWPETSIEVIHLRRDKETRRPENWYRAETGDTRIRSYLRAEIYSPQTREVDEKRRRRRGDLSWFLTNADCSRQMSSNCTCFVPDIQCKWEMLITRTSIFTMYRFRRMHLTYTHTLTHRFITSDIFSVELPESPASIIVHGCFEKVARGMRGSGKERRNTYLARVVWRFHPRLAEGRDPRGTSCEREGTNGKRGMKETTLKG